MSETEQSFAAPAGPRWRTEPFRLFFPLGVLLGWVGIGHWLLYTTGVTATYSCPLHGLIQMQAFMMAFAVGFLLTAVPRRTQGAPPSTVEIAAAALLLVTVTTAAALERPLPQQVAYAALFLLLLQFAARRFVGRAAGRRPPAAFVLIPLGVLQGLAGAALTGRAALGGTAPSTAVLGALLVEQGVFLCFAIGVGSLILPLMAGMPPPPDLGASPRERWKALAYAAAGLTIAASLAAEASGALRAGPLVRAAVVAAGLGLGGGAWRRPGKPGLHRRLVWLAVWLMPLGLAASGLWPDYRVPALHVLFIGGFSLLAFGVATHVSLSHLDLEHLALGRPPAVAVVGVMLLLAMLARVTADWSDSYFAHVGSAAVLWLIGSAVWLAFLGPRLLGRRAPAVTSVSTAAGQSHPPHRVGAAAALLPPALFAVAVASFVGTLATAPFLAGELGDYFYQTRVMALVHGLTLGWISMAMVGVLYRYVPALTKRPLPYPRTAVLQGATFVVGVATLVASFWTGRWSLTAAAAAGLALSALLLYVNLLPLLLRAPRRGVAEVGILLAVAFLVAAAGLGTLLALDKTHPILGGSLLTNLGAHVHLAAVGWVGVTICALSFRFLPAFLLPTVQLPEAARRQILVLAAAVVLLAAALLARSALAPLAAFAVGAALIVYFVLIARVVSSHRMPFDWTARHAAASGLWLLATTGAGCALAVVGAGETETGARLAAGYGVAGLLGWMSNILIGVSYKLFPGFVAGARVERGRRAVPVAELGVAERLKPAILMLHNAGTTGVVAGLLADVMPLLLGGLVALALGAFLYGGATLRTIAFAIVDPAPPDTPLRILP